MGNNASKGARGSQSKSSKAARKLFGKSSQIPAAKPAANPPTLPARKTSGHPSSKYPDQSIDRRGRPPYRSGYQDPNPSRTMVSSRSSHRAAPVSIAFASAVSAPYASQHSQPSHSTPGSRSSIQAPSGSASFSSSTATLVESQPPGYSNSRPETQPTTHATSAPPSCPPTGARSWYNAPSNSSRYIGVKPKMLRNESSIELLPGTRLKIPRAQYRFDNGSRDWTNHLPHSNTAIHPWTTPPQQARTEIKKPPPPPPHVIKTSYAFDDLQQQGALHEPYLYPKYTPTKSEAQDEFRVKKLFEMKGFEFHYWHDFHKELEKISLADKVPEKRLLALLEKQFGVYVMKYPHNPGARQLLKLSGVMVFPNGRDVPPAPPC